MKIGIRHKDFLTGRQLDTNETQFLHYRCYFMALKISPAAKKKINIFFFVGKKILSVSVRYSVLSF